MYQQIELLNYQETKTLRSISSLAEQLILSNDGEVIFYKDLFSSDQSDELFIKLNQTTDWQQDTIKIFGQNIPLPRLTAWYGDEGKSYKYSGIEQHPKPWNPTILEIKSRVEKIAKVNFNSVLLNLYRDGKDSVAWHSDDEPELGRNPIIGSVSFGGTRRFSLKHKQDQGSKFDIELTKGSLLLMRAETQHHWLHQIAKTTKLVSPRINLTFRIIH
jgi:alkylated DNA repair dioxygenase AlkB